MQMGSLLSYLEIARKKVYIHLSCMKYFSKYFVLWLVENMCLGAQLYKLAFQCLSATCGGLFHGN